MKSSTLDRARKYLAAMPGSVAGSGGHTTAFSAASVLVRGFNLPDHDSFALLMEWNTLCLPPWPERELVAKIKSAHRDIRKEYGYLLTAEELRPHQPAGSARKPAPSAPLAPSLRRGYDPSDLEEKATQQVKWPPLRPLTALEKGGFAKLRSLSVASVDIACQNGRLMADDSRPGCVLLTDGRTDGRGHRQYRKLDGSPFHHGKKSDNAKGSAAKGFFSLSYSRRLDPDEMVFISEGSISLLEGTACQWLCEGEARQWHFLASHSAASTFACEPALLKSIAGHHCRILADPGKAGTDAAKAWRNELRAVGCRVDFACMPAALQDLKVLLAAGSDGVAAVRSILTYPTPRQKGGRP